MSEQERTRKMCECGRGPVFTGRWAKYNATNDEGKQVCAECKVEEITNRILNARDR